MAREGNRRIRTTYIAALGSIGLLVGIGHVAFQAALEENRDDARILNVAGRQRMLSQRMAKASLELATATQAEAARFELERSLREFREALADLDRTLPDEDGIQALRVEAGVLAGTLARRVEAVLAAHPEQLLIAAAEAGDAADAFLPRMHALVTAYEHHARGKLDRLAANELAVFGVLLLILLGQALLIFEPLCCRLSAQIGALRAAKYEAQAGNRAKDAFLATISHELRTPLNGIMGLNEILLDCDLGPCEREIVHQSQRSIDGLALLLDQTLQFGQLQSQAYHVEERPFDLAALVHEMAQATAARLHDKGVEMLARIDEEPVGLVLGDARCTRRILNQLLDNAVKFTSAGHVLLQVIRTDEAHWTILVEDSGPGIPEHLQEAVFERFCQVDGSLTRKHEGLGLGLALVRQMVDALGGEIDLESRPGRGTRVQVTLSLPDSGESVPSVPEAPDLAAWRVVVVSPSIALLRTAVGHLTGSGATTETHAGVEQWLAAADRKRGPDLLIYDVDVDNERLELDVQKIRERGLADQAVVLLLSSLERPHGASELGRVRAGLRKPLWARDLFAAIDRLVDDERTIARRAEEEPKPLRVLAVEDNVVNQRVLRAHLARAGHEVVLAAHGGEAVEQMARGTFDLVLMDVHMPIMDGYEATTSIREMPQHAHTPIIALTANADDASRARCREVGMNAFLAKPYRYEALLGVIAENLAPKGGSGGGPVLGDRVSDSYPDPIEV